MTVGDGRLRLAVDSHGRAEAKKVEGRRLIKAQAKTEDAALKRWLRGSKAAILADCKREKARLRASGKRLRDITAIVLPKQRLATDLNWLLDQYRIERRRRHVIFEEESLRERQLQAQVTQRPLEEVRLPVDWAPAENPQPFTPWHYDEAFLEAIIHRFLTGEASGPLVDITEEIDGSVAPSEYNGSESESVDSSELGFSPAVFEDESRG